MEIIIYFLIIAILAVCVGLLFGKIFLILKTPLTTDRTESSNIIRIDDKNWIVNNEFVSFEEDTPINRFKQELEDNEHYRNYERQRLQYERDKIFNQWQNVNNAIIKNPKIKECVTEEKLKNTKNEYASYVLKCKKLDEIPMLSPEDFVILKENVFLNYFKFFFPKPIPSGVYSIYNEKTAKYKGDYSVEKEFNEKWK